MRASMFGRVLACAIGLAALALPVQAARAQGACDSEGSEGLGGTGIELSRAEPDPVEPEGLGGTGRSSGDEGEDGLGGTGIFGTITGFGSICVNGLEVRFDATTPIEVDGQPGSARSLAIGQVVRVAARMAGDGLRARRIEVRSAVVGPISERVAGAGEIRVLGQRVALPPEAIFAERPGVARRLAPADLAPGLAVEVSGLRRADGVIVASRIAPAAAERVRVTGRVTESSGSGLAIGALRVTPERGTAQVGEEVTLGGSLRGGVLVPDALEREPASGLAAGFQDAAIEGFVETTRGREGFRVRGVDVDLSEVDMGNDFAGMPADQRVRVRGRVVDGGRRLVAEGIEVRDSRAGTRGWQRLDRVPGAPDAERSGGGREDRMEREDRSGREERPERPERMERPERPERTERPERPERVERPPERPQRPDRPDRPERPERTERPER